MRTMILFVPITQNSISNTVRSHNQENGTTGARFVYWCAALCVRSVCRAVYRIRVEGKEHFPRDGGVLVIANHQSYLDPPIIASMLNTRRFAFLARAGLFKVPVFGSAIRLLNARPLSGVGNETRAIRDMLRLLDEQSAILVFPEGARTHDGEMTEFARGVLLLLRKSNCPLVPVAIEGFYDAWPRHRAFPKLFGCRLAMRVGEPIDIESLQTQLQAKWHTTQGQNMRAADSLIAVAAHIDQMRLELRSDLRRRTRGRFPAAVG